MVSSTQKRGNLPITFSYNIELNQIYYFKSNDMKKAVLLALAGVLTFSSFAADKNKAKAKKNKKAVKTEQCCSQCCDKTKCAPKPGCCKM